MKRSIVILATLLACLVPHCKKDSNNPTNNPIIGSIVPLKVGNSWTFRVSIYDTNGVILSTSMFTNSITRDTTIGNEKWFGLESIWVINRTDGLWSRTSGGNPYLVFKYPANVNDSYNSNGDNVVVTSTNYPVTVPRGQFTCYVYTIASDFLEYCAPNVGWVKYEAYMRTLAGQRYVAAAIELTSVTLN